MSLHLIHLLSAASPAGRNTVSIKPKALCEGCISLSVGEASFALVIRTADDSCPVALLAIMDALAALVRVSDPVPLIEEECHLFLSLFAHSSHTFPPFRSGHMPLFFCSFSVSFLRVSFVLSGFILILDVFILGKDFALKTPVLRTSFFAFAFGCFKAVPSYRFRYLYK